MDKLINIFKKNEINENRNLKNIPHPRIVLNSLYELKQLAGNAEVKQTVTDQIASFIKTPKKEGAPPIMINALFYGPPGVGKTTTAVILGKIWYGMGLLKPSEEIVKTVHKQEMGGDVFDYYTSEGYSWLTFIGFAVVFSVAIKYRKELGWFNTIILCIILLFLLLALQYYFDRYRSREHTTVSRSTTETKEKNDDVDVNINDIVTVVGPEDFIDLYSGWTPKKSKELLEKNLGKVLFVDEAYGFVNNKQESFGLQALNVLCSFLSEHPGEIIVIFAGYEDLIEQNIFQRNKGLKRRFLWKFNCGGYDYKDLYDIFVLQTKKQGWEISENDEEHILLFFKKNRDLFTEYGGDTEYLSYFCRLNHTKSLLFEEEECTCDNIITLEDVIKGMKKLEGNKMDGVKKEEENLTDIQKLLRKL